MEDKYVAPHSCPLCGGMDIQLYFEDNNRMYLHCFLCKLVFVPSRYWLSRKKEKATYDLHENDEHDRGYRKFLSRLATPLLAKLGTNKKGLDFGCGPGPALSVLLEEHGHQVDLYDPLYYNDSSVFKKRYDFICATEVVEHLHRPDRDFSIVFDILKKGGWLGIMTKMVINKHAFSKWHYIRDLTHICFYCPSTFEYIANRYDVTITFIGADVILFNKN